MPLWTCTALMGPVYAMQRAAASWLETKGVDKSAARLPTQKKKKKKKKEFMNQIHEYEICKHEMRNK